MVKGATRALALVAILIAGLCGPAAAQTVQDAVDWLKSVRVELDGEPYAPRGRELTAERLLAATSISLDSYGRGGSADDLAKLKALPRLVDVRLGSRYGTDPAIAALVKAVPGLRQLDLVSAQITEAALADIATLGQLVDLRLRFSKISSAGMAQIARLSTLQSLDISSSRPDDAGLAAIRDMPALRSLRIDGRSVTREGLAAIAAMPALRELNVWGVNFDEAAIDALAKAKLLDTIRLELPAAFADSGGQYLGKLRGVRRLHASKTGITDRSMAAIGSLPTLEILDLDATAITDAGLAALSANQSLRELRLKGTKITDAGLQAALATRKPLRVLVLRDTAITDVTLQALAASRELEELQLQGTGITDAGLAALTGLPKLKALYLSGTKISDAGMASLAQIKSLTHVYIANTDVGDDGARLLKGAIKSLSIEPRSPTPSRWSRDPRTGCRIWKSWSDITVHVHWSGACVDGVAEGEGVLEWWASRKSYLPPGLYDRYEGRLRNGRRDGPGLSVSKYGTREQGEWRDERFDSGTRIRLERSYGWTIEESVAAGQPFRAIVTEAPFPGRPGGRYEGGWSGNLASPNGPGRYVSNDGTILEGVWERGCLRVAGQHTRSFVDHPPDVCGQHALPAALGKAPPEVQTDAEHWRDCMGEQLDFRIIGCNAVIARARESDANLAIAHNNRGFAYAAFRGLFAFSPRSRPVEALQDFNEAIRLNPSFADAYANRGTLYVSSDRPSFKDGYEWGMRDLDEAIRLNPSAAKAFHLRGRAYARKDQYDRAMQDLDEAIRLDPSLADALRDRASLHANKDHLDRALDDLDQVTRLKPDDSQAWVARCRLGARAGRLDAALQDCSAVLGLRWKSGIDEQAALAIRGLVHFKAGRFDAAIVDYTAALDLTGSFYLMFDSVDILYSRGVARQRNGDAAGGETDIAAAIVERPNVVENMAKHGVR